MSVAASAGRSSSIMASAAQWPAGFRHLRPATPPPRQRRARVERDLREAGIVTLPGIGLLRGHRRGPGAGRQNGRENERGKRGLRDVFHGA